MKCKLFLLRYSFVFSYSTGKVSVLYVLNVSSKATATYKCSVAVADVLMSAEAVVVYAEDAPVSQSAVLPADLFPLNGRELLECWRARSSASWFRVAGGTEGRLSVLLYLFL